MGPTKVVTPLFPSWTGVVLLCVKTQFLSQTVVSLPSSPLLDLSLSDVI